MGYGFSRPDDIGLGVTGRHKSSTQEGHKIGLQAKNNTSWWQHPDKIENASRRSCYSYGIYSLGLVLLEIGLWQSLYKGPPASKFSPQDYNAYILKYLVPDLWGQCGSIYGKVVRDCLTMQTNEGARENESQRMLCWNIAERLDMCVA